MASPAVTVIIPTFNWSAVLSYSVRSALRQKFTDFEVLVVGDGCTDNSGAVIEAMGDARVRWLNLPEHTGHQSGPNNEGLRHARGEFIAYLGHDDLWVRHHLACLVAALDAGADVAYGLTMLVGADGRYTEPAPRRLTYTPGLWIPPTGVAHRRRVIDGIGGWKPYRQLSVDPEVDLWQRAYQYGYRFAFVPRLTAVKFPAAWRRDVYRTRPHHEQARWFERMERESDFEAVEMGHLLLTVLESRLLWRDGSYWTLLREFVAETRRRLRFRWAVGKNIEARRRFKGAAANGRART